ncbi:hypothetical protein CsSME_00014696 [Camellia sinensis var. sinensis]
MFKMPEGVTMVLDKLQASFLWGGSVLKRRVHLAKWSEITKGMDAGGLGIRRLTDVNLCLLAKWWWKFGALDNVLWKNVLRSKYHYANSKWSPPTLHGLGCGYQVRVHI